MDAACPLCGAPLDPAQDWCLTCGAAARTRLAAPANWRAPIVAIAVTGAIALGVLAAALVKLSAGSPAPQAPPAITTTITVPAAPATTESLPPTTGSATPGESTTPGTPTTPGGAAPGGTSTPSTGAVNPGTPTTIAPSQTTGGTGGPSAGTGTKTGTGHGQKSRKSSEEALRKAGFLPRTGK